MEKNDEKLKILISDINGNDDFEEDNFTEEQIDEFFKDENVMWHLKEEMLFENAINAMFEKPPF